jgi:hypothetical protein
VGDGLDVDGAVVGCGLGSRVVGSSEGSSVGALVGTGVGHGHQHTSYEGSEYDETVGIGET